MTWTVENRTRGTLLGTRVERATRFWDRMRGLLGRQTLGPGEGLHILRCNSIHMFFMRFAIDALFLDEDGRVVKLYATLPPWRVSGVHSRARSVLELPAGVAEASGTREGDLLAFVPTTRQQALAERPFDPSGGAL